jgi:hypothetical protein
MATENKGVMVYITPELETVLEKYCIERNITRKTRDGHVFASLGTGIVQYLKSQLLGVESNSGITPSPSMSKDEVLELIKEYSTNNVPSTLPDDSLRGEVEALGELVTELETYTQNQFKAVREELKRATGDRQVSTESIASPTTAKTTPDRPKPEGEADWVTPDNRRFYRLLVSDSELLAKVTNSIELHPTDNKALAESLVSTGLHKADGTALDSSSMSRIKKVVSNLNTPNR